MVLPAFLSVIPTMSSQCVICAGCISCIPFPGPDLEFLWFILVTEL